MKLYIVETLSNDITRLCELLEKEYITNEEEGACLAAYLNNEYGFNDILELQENGQIGTTRDDIIILGDKKYYSFDNILSAQDKTSELLQDNISSQDIQNLPLNILKKFADEDWFDYKVTQMVDNEIEYLINSPDSIFGNKFIRICYNEALLSLDDFEEDEFGEPDFSKCLISIENLKDDYKDDWESNFTEDSINYFINNYGESEFRQEILDNLKNAFNIEYYCDYLSKNEKYRAETLATFDEKERNVTNGQDIFYVYRIS